MHETQMLTVVIKKSFVKFIVFCFLLASTVHSIMCFAIDPIEKVYLKQNGDDTYYLCINLQDNSRCSSRIHMLPNGARIILSFKRAVHPPKTPKIRNHRILNGYFFERIGECSMMFVVSFKEHVVFLEKRCTNTSICLKFRIQKRHTVVIDAGHGGKDPGTRCITGDSEKNIALVVAIELRDKLVESGRYNVTLTRDRDQFLSISRRMEIAGKNADFLISLHTDSSSDRNMRGMAVYTLPTLEFMKHSSAICIENQNPDNYYRTLARSRNFANILVGYIPMVCKLKSKPSRNVELKILKVPYPAVLVELGYVSNKIDNALIHSKEFREKVNRAILCALDKVLGEK